jgi:hypothetical protein
MEKYGDEIKILWDMIPEGRFLYLKFPERFFNSVSDKICNLKSLLLEKHDEFKRMENLWRRENDALRGQCVELEVVVKSLLSEKYCRMCGTGFELENKDLLRDNK